VSGDKLEIFLERHEEVEAAMVGENAASALFPTSAFIEDSACNSDASMVHEGLVVESYPISSFSK